MARGRKPINLERIRAIEAELDKLAEEHPELIGPSSEDEWVEVLKEAERMARKQIPIRLDVELLERIDAHADRIRDSTGAMLNRSDTMRALLRQALDAAEAGDKPRRKRP